MPYVEIIGFLAFILNVVGTLLLAWKKRSGWVVRLVSIVLWGTYAAYIWSPSLLTNACTFFMINCVGFYKWSPQKGQESEA